MKRRFFRTGPRAAARLFFVCAFFAAAAPLFPEDQRIIPLSSPLYGWLDTIALLSGAASPTSARPWSTREALMILDRLSARDLSPEAEALASRAHALLRAPLRFSSGGVFSGDIHLALTTELYAHTNRDAFVISEDWAHGFTTRNAPLRLSFEGGDGGHFYGYVEAHYGRAPLSDGNVNNDGTPGNDRKYDLVFFMRDYDWGLGALYPYLDAVLREIAELGTVSYWSPWFSAPLASNIAGFEYFDFNFPRRAYFSAGGAYWNAVFGRDRLSWGNGHTGNLIVDSHIDYHNFFRFSWFGDRFRFESLNLFFDKQLYSVTEREHLLANGTTESERLLEKKFRIFMAHRFEFRVLDNLVFAVSENVMYQDTAFDFGVLNPLLIYHNFFDRRRFNAIAHLEADYAFLPGWNLYVQAALDQATAPTEAGIAAAAWGILGGIEYGRVLAGGFFTASLEAAYTTPLLYRREGVDFLVSRASLFSPGRLLIPEYLGYPYGGDAVTAEAAASFTVPGTWDISARIFWMTHGKMNFFVSHYIDDSGSHGYGGGDANYPGVTPSGGTAAREHTLIISLAGNYVLPGFSPVVTLSFRAALDYVAKWNKLTREPSGSPAAGVYLPGFSPDVQVTLGLNCTF